MNEPEQIPEGLRDLIDDYLNGVLDAPRMSELEAHLEADADARRYFVRYARLHTDLLLEVRARLAGKRALDTIEHLVEDSVPSSESPLTQPTPRRSLAPWLSLK